MCRCNRFLNPIVEVKRRNPFDYAEVDVGTGRQASRQHHLDEVKNRDVEFVFEAVLLSEGTPSTWCQEEVQWEIGFSTTLRT